MKQPRTVDQAVARLREKHGENTVSVIARQLGCSMLAGDDAGVAYWQAVADSFARSDPQARQAIQRQSA